MFGCLYGAAPGLGRNPFSSGFGLLGSMLTSVRREYGPNLFQGEILKAKSKFKDPTDLIVLGDFNSRVGCPKTDEENEILGEFGEEMRNFSGECALQFLKQCNLVCLNNRNPVTYPQFTYHQSGAEDRKSIIDLICVSQGMMMRNYQANVIYSTLTGAENHFPVTARLRFGRKSNPKEKQVYKPSWNLTLLQNENKAKKFRSSRDQNLENWIEKYESVDLRSQSIESAVDSFSENIL